MQFLSQFQATALDSLRSPSAGRSKHYTATTKTGQQEGEANDAVLRREIADIITTVDRLVSSSLCASPFQSQSAYAIRTPVMRLGQSREKSMAQRQCAPFWARQREKRTLLDAYLVRDMPTRCTAPWSGAAGAATWTPTARARRCSSGPTTPGCRGRRRTGAAAVVVGGGAVGAATDAQSGTGAPAPSRRRRSSPTSATSGAGTCSTRPPTTPPYQRPVATAGAGRASADTAGTGARWTTTPRD